MCVQQTVDPDTSTAQQAAALQSRRPAQLMLAGSSALCTMASCAVRSMVYGWYLAHSEHSSAHVGPLKYASNQEGTASETHGDPV